MSFSPRKEHALPSPPGTEVRALLAAARQRGEGPGHHGPAAAPGLSTELPREQLGGGSPGPRGPPGTPRRVAPALHSRETTPGSCPPLPPRGLPGVP